ncbi:transmembrane protein 70 homolog, mitochondrial [Trichonephila clavipes]|nr:transmembrane protein 70 homolog, mitochondrial [Trichonephila clavipes]
MNFSCIRFLTITTKNTNNLLFRNQYSKKVIPTFHLIHTSRCQKKENETSTKNIVIYEGPLKTRIKRVKLLSLASSMVGFAMLPSVVLDLNQISVALSCGVVLFSSFFCSTPILLDWITRRYVLRLEYDPSTELFTTRTFNIVTMEKELTFSASDVTVPDIPGMLTSFHAKGNPLFVDASRVQDPDAYSKMMGYDKPLDLKLSSEEKDSQEH